MRERSLQDVELGRRTTAGHVIYWLCIFAMLVALLLGNVKLYERKEENRKLTEQLEEQESEARTAEAAETPDLKAQAQAAGLSTPDPAAVKILHIRGIQ